MKPMRRFAADVIIERTGEVKILKYSDIERCPFSIMVPEHYRDDGTCKCDDPEHQKEMIENWGYEHSDFLRAGVRK